MTILISKIINILAFKMAMDVFVEMTIQSFYQWPQKNVIILVLEIRMKYAVLHGDYPFTDQIM